MAGRLPAPAPTTVFEPPHPVTVFAASGAEVAVDDRGALSEPPATVQRRQQHAAGRRVGRTVAGRRALVGSGCREPGQPIPARRRERRRLAARARARPLVGGSEVRLAMGWQNPPIPWSEFERTLSGNRQAGCRRSAPTAATARPGRASATPFQPTAIEPAAGPRRAVRGAARALQLQLPRRREPARGAARGGRPARAARPRAHRPRRLLRGRADGRGGRDVTRR